MAHIPQENLTLSGKQANKNLMHLRNKSPEFINEVPFYSLGNLFWKSYLKLWH